MNSLDSIPIVYLDLELCKQFFQGQIMVNQILARSQDSITPNNLKIGIISSLNENIKSAYTVEEYPPIKLSTEDSQQDSKMINYISIILIITAAITLLIVLTRRIDEDIKQIGVFNALGASKKEIFNSYLIYILIIDSLGILASLILSIGFGSIWSYLIQNMLKMPNLGLNLSLSFSVFNYIAILFPLSLISGFIIIRRTLSLDPMSIIKRESKYLQHTNFVEKIFHWKKKQISPFGKYNLRKMLNQKGYSILTIVALSISVCLLTSSLILMNIIPNSLDNKFEQTEKWDAFGKCWNYENQSQFEENISIIQGIEQISFGIIDTVQLLNDEKKNNDSYENELISNDEELGYYQLSAFQKLNSLHEFPIKEGRKYDDENEILVSIDLKYQLNYNIGDNISIHSLKTSIDYNLTFKIVGFVNDFNQKTLYVPLDIAQIITNQSDKINEFYYTVNLNSEEKIHENIGALNVVQFTMTKEEMKSMWDSLLNMMDMVIPILGIFIIFLAILIILTITKSVISYRTHDYGNLKSIGIYYRDIRNAIWIEMMIFMIISVLLSIPLSDLLMNNLMIEMHSEMPGIIYNFDPLILIYITISSIIMIFGGTLEPLITLKRLPLAKILREKNFG